MFSSAVFVKFMILYGLHAMLQQLVLPDCFIKMGVLFDLQTLYTPLTGKMAMMTSGGTILVMIPASMMITIEEEKCMAMSSTDAASTASSPHTVCTALKATTADEAASAHGHNRSIIFLV